MRNKAWMNAVVMVLIVLTALMLVGQDQQPEAAAEGVKRVRAAALESMTESHKLTFQALVRDANEARLAFTVDGRLALRPVKQSERVARGQLLAKLDQGRMRNGLRTAEAALAEIDANIALAEKDLQRVEALHRAKAATSEELEQMQARRTRLQASRQGAVSQVEEMQRLLQETELRAPFAGTVARIYLEPGEFAAPGVPVVGLRGMTDPEVEISVPESLLTRLDVGQAADIFLPLLDKAYQGRVKSIGLASSGGGSMFPVVIELDPSSKVLPGMTVEVSLALKGAPELTAPLGAVINPGGSHPAVFVIRSGRTEKVPVKVGRLLADRVVVHGDIQAGEQVVTIGHAGLIHGDPVEVVQ